MTFRIIQTLSESEKNTGYITVYKPIAGWKAIQMWWNKDDPNFQFWEPWQTNSWAYATKEEAIEDAKGWAEAEEIPYLESNEV